MNPRSLQGDSGHQNGARPNCSVTQGRALLQSAYSRCSRLGIAAPRRAFPDFDRFKSNAAAASPNAPERLSIRSIRVALANCTRRQSQSKETESDRLVLWLRGTITWAPQSTFQGDRCLGQ